MNNDGLGLRDTIACKLCNWILNNIASKYYRDEVEGLIRLGFKQILESEDPQGKGDVA